MDRSRTRAFIPICLLFLAVVVLVMPARVFAQARNVTVTMGNPGDHWLDAMKYTRVARGRRGQQFGYEITYIVPDIGEKVLFWPRSRIDLDGSAPRKYAMQFIQLAHGRLYWPDRITSRSLPRVYSAILILEGDYSKDARGGKAAAEAFATVIGLASMMPARAAGITSRSSTTAASTRTAAKPTTIEPAQAESVSTPTSGAANTATGGTSLGPRSLGAARASIKLTGKAKRILGGIQDLKDVTVRAAIRARGGTAGVVRKAGNDFAGLFVGNVANAAAQGDTRALKVIKLIKDARRLGQIH